MGLFYKPQPKESLELRNNIFLENGIPALAKNGFVSSPFSTSWYGRDNHNDFAYELCRLTDGNQLEILRANIIRGESWIQLRLNVFELKHQLKSIDDLEGKDGIKFFLPPNSLKEVRLRSDEYKGIPLFYMLFSPEHKIGTAFTENAYRKKAQELATLIKKDMLNIDSFVKKWNEMYRANVVSWNGEVIEER